MKRGIFFVISLMLTFYSCHNSTPNIDSIDVPIESNASLTNFISSSVDVVLENNAKCMLSNIDKLRVYENNLYILDRQLDAILVYNSKGKFVDKLFRKGRGPQEYLYISDFDILDGKLYVLSRSDKKILVYNADMSYVSDIKLNDWYNNLHIADENSILLYSERSNEQGFDIVVVNAQGEVINQHLPFSISDSFNFTISPFNSCQDDGVFVTLPYDNQVYAVLNGDCNVRFTFNFLINDYAQEIKNLTYSEIRNKFKGKEMLKRIEFIAENNNKILMVCNFFFNNIGDRQLLVLLDLNTKKTKVLRLNEKLDDSYPFLGRFMAVRDDMIYSVTNTQIITNIANSINKTYAVDSGCIDHNYIIQMSKIKFDQEPF